MPTVPSNILQAVATFNKSELGALQNQNVFLSIANKKFDGFESKIVSNLGTTVSMRLPYRFISTNGLLPTLQGIKQRLQNLTVDQALSVNCAADDQDRLFNLKSDEYMKEIGMSAVIELGGQAERVVALNANSHVPTTTGDLSNPIPTGNFHTDSGPYRFYGDGVTAINSYEQLAAMHAAFKNYGAVQSGIKVIIPDIMEPAIVGSGLTKFTMDRGNKEASSWNITTFGTPPIEYYKSNMMPIQVAGGIGYATGAGNNVVTITGLVTDSNGYITALQCSTTDTTDSNAIASGDLLQFNDSVSGMPNMRFLTFNVHTPCAQHVQVRATAQCASSGGTITIPIFPSLVSQPTGDQNINNAVQIGMKLTVMPSHLCGLVIGGDALFMAMPKLPDTSPYQSSVETDSETGASMRMWYGYIINQATKGMFRNIIFGSTLVPEYSMRILFPVP